MVACSLTTHPPFSPVRRHPAFPAHPHTHHPGQVGKLFLVDLAGSERLKKSKSVGVRASEAKSINLSLTTLVRGRWAGCGLGRGEGE